MSKKVIVRTNLPNPPPELVYAWGEPYQRFPVKDGVVEGLTPDHPRWHILQYEWKLVVEGDVAGNVTAEEAIPVAVADVVGEVSSDG